ncbi:MULTISPECIES: DNA polymerase Y subunit UmuC family protein [Nitrosomonas]|uniref:hypothetical protein n=1 Tax=Nitrosomonas TaxID=914 RepID=UPI001187348D|nr:MULTISPECIES: hypothetical protein [Nitrosomonas]UVS60004.1 hypothetical protein NX761_10660 [Nitrosomonas sp. PLL12]
MKALRDTQPSWLHARFGVVMERLGYELRGVSCLALEEVSAPRKQMISSCSSGQLVYSLPELSESVASYISSAAKSCDSSIRYVMQSRYLFRPVLIVSWINNKVTALSCPCPMPERYTFADQGGAIWS